MSIKIPSQSEIVRLLGILLINASGQFLLSFVILGCFSGEFCYIGNPDKLKSRTVVPSRAAPSTLVWPGCCKDGRQAPDFVWWITNQTFFYVLFTAGSLNSWGFIPMGILSVMLALPVIFWVDYPPPWPKIHAITCPLVLIFLLP